MSHHTDRGRIRSHRRRGWSASFLVLVLALSACASDADVEVASEAPDLAASAEGIVVEMHRDEFCACCGEYTEYLVALGVEVNEIIVEDTVAVKEAAGVPSDLFSCHTSFVEGYAVEGHVPLEAILDLLEERPEVDAIALAGMPSGSPGMGGEKEEPWTIHAVADGEVSVHSTW